MLRKAIFTGITLAILLLVAGGTAMAQQGDAAKGKTLWGQNLCKNCHGDNGEGKYAGPLAGTQRTVQEVINQARNPRANMPAFDASRVSDQDITDMVAFLKTLTPPASFTSQIPSAQPGEAPGKTLFNQKRCVACHGDGSGLVQSRFTGQGRTVTTEAVLKQLRTPAQRMPMFRANQVSDAEAGQIATFLASLQAPTKAPAAQPPAALPKTGESVASGSVPATVLALGALGLLMLAAGYSLARSRA